MSTGILLITLTTVGVICLIAVLLTRRIQLRLLPAWLASFAWSLGCVLAFYLVQSAWPPLPLTSGALEGEPWESVVWPLFAISLGWPVMCNRIRQWPGVLLWSALLFSSVPILAALCQSERFANMFVGNTAWAQAALLAVGLNWLSIDRMHSSGAGRWSLWIVVGQSLTVAALIMTCYGRFGEWAALAGLALGVVALARLFVSDQESPWLTSVALPALALNAVLIMHIREYRSHPLPLWFPVLPFLMPTIVVGVDMAWSGRFHPILRIVIAGFVSVGLALAIIAIVLKLNGPSEW